MLDKDALHQPLVDDIKGAQSYNGGYIRRDPITGNGVLSLDKIADAVLDSRTIKYLMAQAWERGKYSQADSMNPYKDSE